MKNKLITISVLLFSVMSFSQAMNSKTVHHLRTEIRHIPNTLDSSVLTGRKLSPLPLTFAGLGEKEIALTFDDGPNPINTPIVLQTLKKYGVKATFFVLGENAKKYPELIKQIVAEGHNLANHTWSHKVYQKEQTPAQFRADIIRTHELLVELVGEQNVEPFFRFPTGFAAGTKEAQNMLSELGFANFYWSMSAHDSRTKDPMTALKTSLDMIKEFKKGLFLCHDVRPHTAAMLPLFLEQLKEQGYTTIQFSSK
jgi:peptidoglycan/xylan/chitin deacetylase (PgdA/CDA1 family)